MNERRDQIVTAIGVLVLLIGGAAGAYWMLGMSVVTLAIIAFLYRDRLRLSSFVAMGVAAVVAFAAAYAMSS